MPNVSSVLLLFAGVQSVKILNWPAPTPTPAFNLPHPNVDVAWATFWVAALAFAVAFIGALLARGAFKTAKDDLEISRKNWEIVTRAPTLQVNFDILAPLATQTSICPRGNHVRYAMPELVAYVQNSAEGKRRCDAFFIEVVVPGEALSLPERARLTQQRYYGYSRKSQVVEQMLFPGGGSTVVTFQFPFDYAARITEFELEYRLKDDFNDYPPDRRYLTTRIRLPSRPQFEFLFPRDEAEGRMYEILSGGQNGPDEAWHDKYTHAFEQLDAAGFKLPDERMKAAEEIAYRIQNEG